MDPVIDSIKQVKIKQVKIFISKDHLQSGFPTKGLWPIVNFSFKGKTITISLRQAYINRWVSRQETKLIMSIKNTILRLLGLKLKSLGIAQERVFNQQTMYLISKIDLKIRGSVYRKNIVKARNKNIRKQIVSNLKIKLSQFIKSWNLKSTDIQKHEIATMWDELMKELIVAEIHNK